MIPIEEEFDENRSDALDLGELYRTLLENRKIIKWVTAFFFALGILVAIFTPNQYESRVVLMPEMESQGSDAGSLLQSYGGFLGLGELGSLGSMNEGVIPPQVYPMIVQSPSFLHRILSEELYFSELEMTLSGYQYFEEFYRPAFFELLTDYTIKLPSRFSDPQYPPSLPDWVMTRIEVENPIVLSDKQLETIDLVKDRLEVILNVESGVLNISVVMPDRAGAAQFTNRIVSYLKEFLESYSTQKAKEDLEFTELQFDEARSYFDIKQEELATFLDQNSNISSAKVRAQEQKLQAEFDIAYNRYQNVSDKLLEARVKVQESTPVFKTIQELNVPATASQPNRPLLIIFLLALGLFFSFITVAVLDLWQKIGRKLE